VTEPDDRSLAADAGRRLAILFTDVEGSTQLRSTVGDAAADEVLRIHEGIVREQIARHGGDEVLFMFAGQSGSILALHLAYAGRAEEAVQVVESLRPAFPVAGRVNTLGSWNVLFGSIEALAVAGRRDEAAALHPLVIDALEHRGEWITFDCRLTRTRAAIAAASAGRYREGEEVFRSALEAAEELDLRIEAADVRRLLAGLLLERAGDGDAAEAGRLLDEASASYARMGMLRFDALARSMRSTGDDLAARLPQMP
jgi:class 3 adenylate cyclase